VAVGACIRTASDFTLWYIWKWRCASYFEATEGIPIEKEVFLLRKFRQVIQALANDDQVQGVMRSEPRERWVRWDPPLGGWRVLNTDGAVKGTTGPAGARGVLRDDKGEWIMDFSEYLGRCSAVKAEIRAVLWGFKLAKEVRTQRLWLQMDSNVVVGMLTRRAPWHPEYSFILQQCTHLLDGEGWEVQITHCFGEANQVADKGAKKGLEGSLEVQTHRT